MPGARDVRAGKAYVELSTKDKMSRGLARAQARLRRFGAACEGLGRTMVGLGATIAGPVVASLKIFSSLGDAAAKMARRTGLSVRAVQELGFAAKLSGTDVGSLEKGIKRMQRNLYDAERGLSTSVDALRDLGLSVKDLQGLKPEDQFTLMAERMGQIEDASRRAALAQVVFGRAGTMLLPMFEKGAAGVGALRKRFRELGIALTDEECRAAEVFTDTMADVWASLKHGVALIGSALAPSLKDLAATVVATVRKWAAWIRENRELVAQYVTLALKIGAWTVGLGAALVAVGKLIGGVGALVGVFKGLAVAVAFLGGPMTLAIAGLAGLFYAMRKLSKVTVDLTDSGRRLREEHEKMTAADQARLRRLGQLAEAEDLNNEDMTEAAALIRILDSHYEDLGLSIDGATRSVLGFAGAQRKAREQMRAVAVQRLNVEYAESTRNLKKIEEARKEIVGPGIPLGDIIYRRLSGFPELNELDAKREKQFERRREILAQLAALEEPPEIKPKGKAAAGAASRAAAAARPWEETIFGKAHAAGLKAQRERAEAAALDEARMRSERAQGFRMEADAQGEAADLRLAALETEERIRYDVARAELRATKEGVDLRLALLELERRQEIAHVPEGVDVSLIERLYEARRQAILAGVNAAKVARRVEVRGQFGGLGAERLGGANTAERMVKDLNEIAKNTKPLRRAGSLVFG